MGFGSVRDQDVPVRLLRNMMVKRRIPNGLLFWGPGGVGKRFTALEAAKAINCEAGAADACDTCLSCRKMAHGTHPDLKQIAPSGKTRIIKNEAVDAINELTAYRPYEGRYRVFIIHDAERMRVEAQNHFLKTLEEPPSATVFMLLSEYPRQLLATIRSRCQHVRFGALKRQTVAELLRAEREVPDSVAAAIAAISQGQMSRALDLVDTPKRDIVLSMTQRLESGEDPLLTAEDFVRQVKAAGETLREQLKTEVEQEDVGLLSAEERQEAKEEQEAYIAGMLRRDLMEYLYLLQTWYRDQLVSGATGEADQLWNRDQQARLGHREQARQQPEKLSAIERAWIYIERNLNPDRVFRDLCFVLSA